MPKFFLKPIVKKRLLYPVNTPSLSSGKASVYGSQHLQKAKTTKNRLRIVGDSLTDQGKKYNEKIFGIIPYRWFLPKSKHDQFTNAFVWALAFENELLIKRNHTAKGFNNINLPSFDRNPDKFFINEAEGGATAFRYSGFLNLFRYFKGWFMGLFLGNIQNQADSLKSQRKGLSRDDIAIIFAGANDLITVGYPNRGGATRAVEGIRNTIKILSQGECHSVVLVTVPDIGKTPRYLKKSKKERESVTQACEVINQGIRKLAENYQYVDFSFCDVYQVANKADLVIEGRKRNAVVITGVGQTRRVYFIKEGEFIVRDGKEVTVDIKLSKLQQRMFAQQPHRVKRTEENCQKIDKFVSELAERAQLNVDIKIFDAAAKFDEIYENPEKYGFTSGCAVYYCDEKAALNLEKIDGNAVILMPMEDKVNQYQLYIFHDGQLLDDKDLKLVLSDAEKQQLEEKLNVSSQTIPHGLVKLVGREDAHDSWTTGIVQRSVQEYEKVSDKKIRLADIYVTMLEAAKENLPPNSRMSWDGVHPDHIVHFIFAAEFEDFFDGEYKIGVDRKWSDDMALLQDQPRKSPSPFTCYEAPARMVRAWDKQDEVKVDAKGLFFKKSSLSQCALVDLQPSLANSFQESSSRSP